MEWLLYTGKTKAVIDYEQVVSPSQMYLLGVCLGAGSAEFEIGRQSRGTWYRFRSTAILSFRETAVGTKTLELDASRQGVTLLLRVTKSPNLATAAQFISHSGCASRLETSQPR